VTDFRATYRLQLGPNLDFRGARELVPYLRELGISHLYLSPSMQARAGSTHGYDVVDPTSVSEELGGEEELRRLCEAGLGIVLDVVPNHMAVSDEENPFWRDPLLRAKFFDLDWRTGLSRRFFDVSELAGVRIEDPEVFEVLSRKVIELVREGLVDGVRIDHPDGLANPTQYFRRLRESGVEHVWIEKILEPGEQLRDWPVEGTTGYEFLNDTTALFVDPSAEEPLTRLYEEVTGEARSFEEVAADAKLEQARSTFEPEVDRLRASLGDAAAGLDLPLALASFPVYRTYVDPDSGLVDGLDREAVREARLPPHLAAILLLEERGFDAFVIRFQQTTPPVMAKGVEDTAFYRYHRLVALNEVGGSPGRFSLPLDEFHAANLERARRFPLHLLSSQTHDTKRSGDVRARLVALSWLPDEWAELVRSVEIPAGIHPNDAYLVLQTLVGAWPLTRERLDGYLEKAVREGKLRSSWLGPDEVYERRLQDFAWSLPEDVAPFARRLAELGAQIALAQTLLKLACPGIPDIYQGDEVWSINLVDPDNRRPVDWDSLRRERGNPKQNLIRRALAERIEGEYEPVDAPEGVYAFTRGRHLVAVPIRTGVSYEAPAGWSPVAPGLYVR
jgi:(1->4)-alpha-D-glucan 1-alpha-D-glucosylmutase